MDIHAPTALLGGLSATQFMRRHWQKKPLLIRQAWPGVTPPLGRAELFALAAEEGVESRLVTRVDGQWKLRHGPFSRSRIPPMRRPGWTLLVQGLDLHCEAAHAMLAPFRFIADARMDDLMLSYASDGGGVGPHTDAYDVFLIQVHGQRRWHVGPVTDQRLVDGLPVRILANFAATESHLLAPGDMLYLPPGWGHDGVAVGECMTCSVGFRAPTASAMAQALLQGLADALDDAPLGAQERIYRDAAAAATDMPARLPSGLHAFARQCLDRALHEPHALDRVLGELVTEPKPTVWFDAGEPLPEEPSALRLDRRTRMAYDDRHVFINGEAFEAAGRDARLVRQLADQRQLAATAVARLSPQARALLDEWCRAGWLHACAVEPPVEAALNRAQRPKHRPART